MKKDYMPGTAEMFIFAVSERSIRMGFAMPVRRIHSWKFGLRGAFLAQFKA